ncbi:MAG: hypothetical protein HYR71_01305 [Chloroflexi bacterium]|nr:hypothetical protein [Chloroflexota bacterium]
MDPFTGSGTVQVEAIIRGISSVGVEVDPLACIIARAKTTPIDPKRSRKSLDAIKTILAPVVPNHLDRELRPGSDISEERFETEIARLTIPPIPNITHWFRRYVIIDLARILSALEQVDLTRNEKLFFKACIAAIIRRVSNADPDPVSGLEVTSLQAERNLKRKIKVFAEFLARTRQAIEGMEQLWNRYRGNEAGAVARVIQGDTLQLTNLLADVSLAQDGFPLVITSPPYCRAVEYSRRHQLEMYWLGLVHNPTEQIALTHTYIGRKLVRSTDWDEQVDFGITRLNRTLNQIADHDPIKARTVRHYFYSIQSVFQELDETVRRTGTVVYVIGDSVCCGVPIATADFVVGLAADNFDLKKRFSYALRNHYMQYGLWNGDGIKREHVLIFKPR